MAHLMCRARTVLPLLRTRLPDMSPFDPDDILALAAQRAAGIKLSAPEQSALDRAMLDDPDLALLIVDAAEVSVATAPAQRTCLGAACCATASATSLPRGVALPSVLRSAKGTRS